MVANQTPNAQLKRPGFCPAKARSYSALNGQVFKQRLQIPNRSIFKLKVSPS